MKLISEIKWNNRDKKRLYRCIAGKDLIGDWFLTKFWSSSDTQHGGQKTEVYKTKNELQDAIEIVLKERTRRGYVLVEHC